MHILVCWQGEFVQKSRASLVDDHSLYSCDLNVWFRDGIVGRNLMLVTGMVLLGEIWCWSLLGFKGLHEKWLFSLQGRMWKIYTRLVLITVWIKNFYSDYNKVRVLVKFSQVWNFFKSYLDTVSFSGIRSRFSSLGLVLILVGEGVFSLLICLFVRLLF